MAWKRFVGHKAAVACSAILGLLVLAVVLSPLTTRYGVNESVKAPPNSYLSPSKLEFHYSLDLPVHLSLSLLVAWLVQLLASVVVASMM